MIRRSMLVAVSVGTFLTLTQPAAAQTFGIGPRLSFVRGDLQTATPSQRFTGATMRLQTSKHVGIEVALDYKSTVSQDGSARLRELPLQASLLIFLGRHTFSPYLLGGFGTYTQATDIKADSGLFVNQTIARKNGVHLGFGAELFLARHAAFFADYRFRFVKFGSDIDPGDQQINIPGSSLIPGLNSNKLSHHGSMWTTGVAFYF
jgi:Outer membrane protein beta-barrel domain